MKSFAIIQTRFSEANNKGEIVEIGILFMIGKSVFSTKLFIKPSSSKISPLASSFHDVTYADVSTERLLEESVAFGIVNEILTDADFTCVVHGIQVFRRIFDTSNALCSFIDTEKWVSLLGDVESTEIAYLRYFLEIDREDIKEMVLCGIIEDSSSSILRDVIDIKLIMRQLVARGGKIKDFTETNRSTTISQ